MPTGAPGISRAHSVVTFLALLAPAPSPAAQQRPCQWAHMAQPCAHQCHVHCICAGWRWALNARQLRHSATQRSLQCAQPADAGTAHWHARCIVAGGYATSRRSKLPAYTCFANVLGAALRTSLHQAYANARVMLRRISSPPLSTEDTAVETCGNGAAYAAGFATSPIAPCSKLAVSC